MKALILIAAAASVLLTVATFLASNRAADSLSRMERTLREVMPMADGDAVEVDYLKVNVTVGNPPFTVEVVCHRRKNPDGQWESDAQMAARLGGMIQALKDQFPS